MSYQTFRVEITRDETVAEGGVGIEIIAYLDRVPETNDYSRGMLTRVPKGVWNSRLQFAGDFEDLGEALAAIGAAYSDIDRIRCYEYTVDDEFAREVAPLLRPTRYEDVYGILKYSGPPKTLEEMDAAITAEVKRRRARGRY